VSVKFISIRAINNFCRMKAQIKSCFTHLRVLHSSSANSMPNEVSLAF
jgi:hypothetical protein